MDFLLGLLTGIAIGFIWGVWRATQGFIQRIIDKPEEIREIMSRVQRISKEESEDAKTTDQAQSDIKIEEHQGVVYLYDTNNEFLAQGADVATALAAAERRFPDRKFSYRLNLPNESNQ
jgi:hypothetical protein